MKCSKCGADFPDDAKFCPYCGKRVSVPSKGKGEAEGVKELTLGLVKLLGSALGVSVLLNMKLLLEQDGEPSKATEKVEDMLRSADLYGEKEEAAVKEAEEFYREMDSQLTDAVSEAVGSVSGSLEKAFAGIGKVVGKVASEFEKAVAKAEPEEKAEETADAADKAVDEAAEEAAEAAEEIADAVDEAVADVEKTIDELFESDEEIPAPEASEDTPAEEAAAEEIPIADLNETKETPSWFVMSDATGQELLEEELYSGELAGERVYQAEPEAAPTEEIPVGITEEAEAEEIPVGITEEAEAEEVPAEETSAEEDTLPIDTSEEEAEEIPIGFAEETPAEEIVPEKAIEEAPETEEVPEAEEAPEAESIPVETDEAEPESISIDIFAEPDKEPWPIGIADAEPAAESTEIGIDFEDEADEAEDEEEEDEADEAEDESEDEESDEEAEDDEEESDDEEDEDSEDEADDEDDEESDEDDEPEGDEEPELPVDEDEKPEEDFLFNNLFGDDRPEAAEAADKIQDAVDEFLDEIPENNAAAIDELLSFGREDGAEKQPAQFREDPLLFDIFHKADETLFEEPKEEDIHINTPAEGQYDVDDDADDIFSQRIPDDENGVPDEIIIEEPEVTEPESIAFNIFANGGAPEPAKKFDEYDCEDEPDEVDFPIEF